MRPPHTNTHQLRHTHAHTAISIDCVQPVVRCGAQHPPRAVAAWTVAIFGSVCVCVCVCGKSVRAGADASFPSRVVRPGARNHARARARSRALTHTLNKRDNAGWSLTLTHSLTHVCTHTRASAKRKACLAGWIFQARTQHSHRNDNTQARATQTLAHKPEVGVTDVTSQHAVKRRHTLSTQPINYGQKQLSCSARACSTERAGRQ